MSAPRAAHGLLLAATLLLLGGCASHSARKAPPVAAEVEMATQQAREAVLLADPDWSLAGRVALANGSRGGSGRLEWRQAADHYSVALSAPITRQSWRLTVNPGGATIEGLDGGPRHGLEPSALLLHSTGWQVPVEALPAWLRGARAPGLGEATLQFGADGRLQRMVQGGWTIEYANWRLPDEADGGIAMPHRMEAVREDARVRLVVDAWDPVPADG